MFVRWSLAVLCTCLALASTRCAAQNGPVVVTGAMRNTLFNGQLAGLIQMDSIAHPGGYGIGPMEYLRGELMLWNGIAYRSTVVTDTTMEVEERPDSRAPFFVHQHVPQWTEVPLPDSITDQVSLDAFLTAHYAHLGAPFAFRLEGTFAEVTTHIVNVPPGTVINGPDDAHRELAHHAFHDRRMDLLGFFSTRHKAVFTHHDTNIHVHAITAERDGMGHVEGLRFLPGSCRLFVASVLR